MSNRPRRIVWAPKAKRDLSDIWRYYARVASPDVADKVLREIDHAAGLAGERPLTWRTRDEVMPGLRSVLAQPYTVFYRPTGHEIQVVRVLHERRNFAAAFQEKQE